MFILTNSTDTSSVTFLPGLGDGLGPCASPASPTTSPSGRVPVPVSPLVTPGKARRKPIPATSGPISFGSSASSVLQSSLVNRLQAQLNTAGSMEYVMTWRRKSTPSGRMYCQLVASARPTSGPASGGWPSPAAQNAEGGANPQGNTGEHSTLQTAAALCGWPTPNLCERGTEAKEAKEAKEGGGIDLQSAAILAGWATPRAEDSESTGAHRGVADTMSSQARLTGYPTPNAHPEAPNMSTTREKGRQSQRQTEQGLLAIAQAMVGWATPTVQDAANCAGPSQWLRNSAALNVQAVMAGTTSASPPAETANRGVLNPTLPRWLMGFPATHDHSAPGFASWELVQKLLGGLSPTPKQIASFVSKDTATPLFRS